MGDENQANGEKLIRIHAFTMVISAMSATVFNIVLPEIRGDFSLSYSQVSWVTSAYMLIYAVGSVIYGKLADLYKVKYLITFGLIFFAFGSLIGLSAQAYWMVLLGRVLQAMGAAVIPATAMIIPVRYFPRERRGRALGTAAAGLALGFALGPVVSALLLSVTNWRLFFLIPIVTLFTIPFYRKYMIDEQQRAASIDWTGGSLLIGTVVLLLLAVLNGSWPLAVWSLCLFGLLLVRIQSAEEPFIQPSLFRKRRYSLGLAIAFLTSSLGYSIPFLSPLVLTEVHHLAPGWIGLALVPGALAAAFFSKKGGSLADSIGNSVLFYLASSLLLTCFILLSCLTGAPPIFISFFLIFGQVGQIFMNIAMSNSVSQTLPKEQAGVGMGLLALTNFIGSSLSAGVYSKAVDLGSSFHWNPLNIYPETNIFSNIYFMIAFLYVCISILFYISFGRKKSKHKLHPRKDDLYA